MRTRIISLATKKMSSYQNPPKVVRHYIYDIPERKLNKNKCKRCNAGLSITNKTKYCNPCIRGADITDLVKAEEKDSRAASTPFQLCIKALDIECGG
jgi:hypothetical protein